MSNLGTLFSYRTPIIKNKSAESKTVLESKQILESKKVIESKKFLNYLINKIYLNIDLGNLKSSTYIPLPMIPNTPLKGTYDKNATTYAVTIINNFLSKILNKFTIMDIPGFNDFTTKYYKYSKDKNPIAFSRISNDNKTIIICFRGSQTLIDFIDDSKYNYYNSVNGVFPPQNNPELNIYTSPGFTNIYNENGIRRTILAEVAYHVSRNPKKLSRIFICGHSLGSSLAFLLANELGGLYPNIVEVYGIAPPKTGDLPFSASVKDNCTYTLSLINLADIVPSIVSTYMYNKNKPNIPCVFSHIEPIAVFNYITFDIENCHLINSYYDGVITASPSIITNASAVPNITR
jgi:hypothetical protein